MNKGTSNRELLISIKKFIEENVNFSSLIMDKGIYEYPIEGIKSFGVSYERDEDTNEPIYIYNFFIGDEYINISAFGTSKNPIPNEVVVELSEYWNWEDKYMDARRLWDISANITSLCKKKDYSIREVYELMLNSSVSHSGLTTVSVADDKNKLQPITKQFPNNIADKLDGLSDDAKNDYHTVMNELGKYIPLIPSSYELSLIEGFGCMENNKTYMISLTFVESFSRNAVSWTIMVDFYPKKG